MENIQLILKSIRDMVKDTARNDGDLLKENISKLENRMKVVEELAEGEEEHLEVKEKLSQLYHKR